MLVLFFQITWSGSLHKKSQIMKFVFWRQKPQTVGWKGNKDRAETRHKVNRKNQPNKKPNQNQTKQKTASTNWGGGGKERAKKPKQPQQPQTNKNPSAKTSTRHKLEDIMSLGYLIPTTCKIL